MEGATLSASSPDDKLPGELPCFLARPLEERDTALDSAVVGQDAARAGVIGTSPPAASPAAQDMAQTMSAPRAASPAAHHVALMPPSCRVPSGPANHGRPAPDSVDLSPSLAYPTWTTSLAVQPVAQTPRSCGTPLGPATNGQPTPGSIGLPTSLDLSNTLTMEQHGPRQARPLSLVSCDPSHPYPGASTRHPDALSILPATPMSYPRGQHKSVDPHPGEPMRFGSFALDAATGEMHRMAGRTTPTIRANLFAHHCRRLSGHLCLRLRAPPPLASAHTAISTTVHPSIAVMTITGRTANSSCPWVWCRHQCLRQSGMSCYVTGTRGLHALSIAWQRLLGGSCSSCRSTSCLALVCSCMIGVVKARATLHSSRPQARSQWHLGWLAGPVSSIVSQWKSRLLGTHSSPAIVCVSSQV